MFTEYFHRDIAVRALGIVLRQLSPFSSRFTPSIHHFKLLTLFSGVSQFESSFTFTSINPTILALTYTLSETHASIAGVSINVL